MDAVNQWLGDTMILQMLCDSDNVNEQEREVLQRWILAAEKPEDGPPPLPAPSIRVTHETDTVYCADVPKDKVPPHDDYWSLARVIAHGEACASAATERAARIAESDEFYGTAVPVAIADAIRSEPAPPQLTPEQEAVAKRAWAMAHEIMWEGTNLRIEDVERATLREKPDLSTDVLRENGDLSTGADAVAK
jgi:hypothetical protein